MLYRLEPAVRSWFALLYQGTNCFCPVCSTSLSRFITMGGDQLCPKCGSLSRNRRLWLILQPYLEDPAHKVLDFSPSRCIYRWMKVNVPQYMSSDLSKDFIADHSYDITQLPLESNQFHVVVCYHILEHVEEDLKAMEELHRILRPGGTCLIQTPFQDGETYEDPNILSPEDRLKHFGQEDHVRIYGIIDLQQRLENCGFSAQIQVFDGDTRMGLKAGERVLVCTKPK